MNVRMVSCKKCELEFMTVWKKGTIVCPKCGAKDELIFDKKKPSWLK